jgi:glycosyltransferase involved in cell wall biosynthesis
MDKISIIMPVLNQKKNYLAQSIESILKQTYENLEFIIVDDGSDNETKEALRKYASKDKRIKIITNSERLDISKSMNKAIQQSSGEYIARMDSDDISTQDRLVSQMGYLDANGLDLIGGNCLVISENGKELGKREVPLKSNIKSRLMKGNFFVHSTLFGKRKAFLNLYDEKIFRAQDYELLLRLMSKGYRLGYLNKIILKYRINPNGMTSKNSREQEWYALKARIKAIFQYNYGYFYSFYILRSFLIFLLPYRLKIFIVNKILQKI